MTLILRRSASNQLRQAFTPPSHVRKLDASGTCSSCDQPAAWLLLWKTPRRVTDGRRTYMETQAQFCAGHAKPLLPQTRAAMRLAAVAKP